MQAPPGRRSLAAIWRMSASRKQSGRGRLCTLREQAARQEAFHDGYGMGGSHRMDAVSCSSDTGAGAAEFVRRAVAGRHRKIGHHRNTRVDDLKGKVGRPSRNIPGLADQHAAVGKAASGKEAISPATIVFDHKDAS